MIETNLLMSSTFINRISLVKGTKFIKVVANETPQISSSLSESYMDWLAPQKNIFQIYSSHNSDKYNRFFPNLTYI